MQPYIIHANRGKVTRCENCTVVVTELYIFVDRQRIYY